MKYDLTVFGGGTAGIAAAYIAAKSGLKTLLVEKTDVLGGSITQGLVIPAMKVDDSGINSEFFGDLKEFAARYNAQHTYSDGNTGWFNPELLKIVFDDMLSSVKCDVLFSTYPSDISFRDNFKCELSHRLLSLHIDTNYIIDATSEGKIFQILNFDFQKKSEKNQMPSLRFIMSGIDTKKFADYILKLDVNRKVTTAEFTPSGVFMSTACTSDEKANWALLSLFKRGVEKGDLEQSDIAYFQLFSIPGMPSSLAFNCPRIFPRGDLTDAFVYSEALKQGRERVFRLSSFFVKTFPGFENAYISHISDMLGIRESVRIKGKYTLTKHDIINNTDFDNIAFTSDYPIDIHSNDGEKDVLSFTNHTYKVPVDCLICDKCDKLYAAGKILSADFEAQAAVRTQINCFSAGEAAAKDIFRKIKKV